MPVIVKPHGKSALSCCGISKARGVMRELKPCAPRDMPTS